MRLPRSIVSLALIVSALAVVASGSDSRASGDVTGASVTPAVLPDVDEPTAASVTPRDIDRAPGGSATPASVVSVAVANLREGSLVRHGADLRAGQDRQAFARRLLARPGAAPDAVLLQEVLGTARRVSLELNAELRSRHRPARYAVATSTASGFTTGRCDGARRGRFSVLRSSSVLVNTATVTDIQARGTVRTWGRWSSDVEPVTGRGGQGCTEHPWVRLTVRTPDGPRTATLLDVHVAPSGDTFKSRAIATLRRSIVALSARMPTDLVVLAGDFNVPRCGATLDVERAGCAVRRPHRGLLDAGFRDAVRHRHPSGPMGVAGVSRRIDFIYTRSSVAQAWWDRCYQAYHVVGSPCGARSVFAEESAFVSCETRALYEGSEGPQCRGARFRSYYSDHPMLTAGLTPTGREGSTRCRRCRP